MGYLFTKDEQPTMENFNKRFSAIAVSINNGWTLLENYETAGTYTWTAPDLFNGEPYKVGIVVIGAGGSGAATAWTGSSSSYYYAYGGNSGYSQVFTLEVAPGDNYDIVVGAGGLAVTTGSVKTDTRKAGATGGSSSFNGVVANGGSGGGATISNVGSQVSRSQAVAQWGGEVDYKTEGGTGIVGSPNSCYDPFAHSKMLGAGGLGSASQQTKAYSGGKDPATGLGGGDAAIGSNTTITAGNATAPGCGGGGCTVYVGSSVAGQATSGAGADGAVKIYVRRVAR